MRFMRRHKKPISTEAEGYCHCHNDVPLRQSYEGALISPGEASGSCKNMDLRKAITGIATA